MGKYVNVIIDLKGLNSRPFTYFVPDEDEDKIKIGTPVAVPFGKQGITDGFVIGFENSPEPGIKIKEIAEIKDEKFSFSPEFMQLFIWMSKYYACDLNTVISNVFPGKLFGKYTTVVKRTEKKYENPTKNEQILLTLTSEKKPINAKTLKQKSKLSYSAYRKAFNDLKEKGVLVSKNVTSGKINAKTEKYVIFQNAQTTSKRAASVLESLENVKEMKLSEFLKIAHTTPATIKKLETAGNLKIENREVYRNPLNIYKNLKRTEFPKLTDEQQAAYDFILKKIEEKTPYPILLHGVTASGKTEVYFALMKKVLESGKNVLFLAPEIALASMLTKKTAERFGTETTAVWHSNVSDSEKRDIRERINDGKVRILIGARSAVFAPLQNIGLIISDEEHDDSYKQTAKSPYYNANEVARMIAHIRGAAFLKGSATPDICSYYEAKTRGTLVSMTKKYNGKTAETVEIIDMREEISAKGQRIFSKYLINAVDETLRGRKQVLLLMNRLGFSTTVRCGACGEILKCPNCDLPLTFHKSQKKLKCSHCDYETQAPEICPHCGEPALKFTGTGSERIEEITAKIFPDAKIARMDTQALTGKNDYIKILDEFLSGQIDILIGTQMSAKGLDNPNVTLVGALNTDTSFSFPDYRCDERGFQLLTQLAGRAGRGDEPARIIFQTFNPEFFAFKTACEQNYEKFYENEIKLREEFKFPPFAKAANITVCGAEAEEAKAGISKIREKFCELVKKHNLNIEANEPQPCFFEKINNEYRYSFMIKNFEDKKGHLLISGFFTKIKAKNLKITADMSPKDFL